MTQKTLIMVDLQNDFCPGGNLAVPEGDQVVLVANQLQPEFDLVIATKDWHPADHVSFASNHPGHAVGDEILVKNFPQRLWPDHCVQGSHGAEFHLALHTSRIHKIFYKGTDKSIDSYSAFFDNAHLRATGLGDFLKANHVSEIYLMGLATDFCVKYSCLDALRLGFRVNVIRGACRGIGDVKQAFEEMRLAGAKIL